jgi:threonine dehydrogenase-like Zn-dependent dehydrogenase
MPSLGVLPYSPYSLPEPGSPTISLMRAVAVFPADRRFAVIDHPEPSVTSPTEVKLRMLDVGICGTDKEIVSFEYGTPPAGSPYLIIGHESLGEVVEIGPTVKRVKPGDLAVPTVRRPCPEPACIACRAGRQDFCYTGKFTERGINQRHGFMTEFVVEQECYLNPVPHPLRDVAVLVEPLTIAEKGIAQLKQIQQRLPWREKSSRALVLGGGPVGLLGAMKLVLEGLDTTVYSRTPAASDLGKLVESFGAKFAPAETTSIPDLVKQMGSPDVVYEAVGASSLAFEVIPYLSANGVFIFTGVPGRKGPVSIDTDAIMRDAVLKNQLIFGTVNASTENFADAIADVGSFLEKWPAAIRSLITRRWPIDQAAEPLAGKSGGIKNVIAIAN